MERKKAQIMTLQPVIDIRWCFSATNSPIVPARQNSAPTVNGVIAGSAWARNISSKRLCCAAESRWQVLAQMGRDVKSTRATYKNIQL
jgi:hypothetical protein